MRPARAPHGTATWSTAEWRDEAVAWLDERLAAAGIERLGDVEQPHLRPWATVLKATTTGGTLWLKAAGPGTAFEVALYELLAQVVPDRVLAPIAADPSRGWIVLPDGGPPVGERLAGTDLADALVSALVQYGQLQRDLSPHVGRLHDLGVADMRPARMPGRFEEALDATAALVDGSPADQALHRRVAGMASSVAVWCEQLEASAVPPSLDHNDLHPWNILGDGSSDARFYDWGDSVIAHPFAAMLVPLGFVQRLLDAGLHDRRFLRARDAYLEGFVPTAPHEDLASTLEVACRAAKIARALTWHRALQAARQQGEEIADDWSAAPLESLFSLLDGSYLGGA